MASMYELSAQYAALLDMANDDDIDPDVVADTMEAIKGEIEDKADNVAKVLKELNGQAEMIQAEEQRLAARRIRIQMAAGNLKHRLEELMRLTGKTKFKTDLFSFGIQKNGGKQPLVLDVEVSALPAELTKPVPDNNAIRKYIEKHGECEFAHLEGRGESLRIR